MGAIVGQAVDKAIVSRQLEIVAALSSVVSPRRVLHDRLSREVYARDPVYGQSARPLAVVLPTDIREISQIMRFCYETGVKVFPRGGGTSLTGGAIAAEDGISLCLSQMRRIIGIDEIDRSIRVEAGVTNADISRAVISKGLQFAPNPSLRDSATIGGNISTNAGGTRALKYGTTSAHVLALRVVLIDGEIVELGSGELGASGFDLLSMFVGSEGSLGVIAEATLRLQPVPDTRRLLILGFSSLADAADCAIAMPTSSANASAIELLDNQVVAVCEQFGDAALPTTPAAILIVEFEGGPDATLRDSNAIKAMAGSYGAGEYIEVEAPDQLNRVQRAFDGAFTALSRYGRLHYLDIAVPPSRCSEALARISSIAVDHGVRLAHMCRPAEGVIRSVFIEETGSSEQLPQIENALVAVARMTGAWGGTVGAEHGIGLAKLGMLEMLPGANAIPLQMRLKTAFDAEWLLNKGKIYRSQARARSL